MELIIALDFIITELMGSSISQQSSSRLHPIFGHYTLIQPRDGSTALMILNRLVDSQEQFSAWKKQLCKIDSPSARKVLFLPHASAYQQANCCASGKSVQLTYDGGFTMSLQSQIQIRRKKKNYFFESELWFLLYALIGGGRIFQKQRRKIGDVHPSNILVSQKGEIRLISKCSFPREGTNFDKLLENSAQKVFLAPEQLSAESMLKGEYAAGIDPSLAECFSIGLCVLAAATLQDMDSIYIMKDGVLKIQPDLVNEFLEKLRLRYGTYFNLLVTGLLEANPSQRMKCTTIYSSISIFQQQIQNLQPFFPSSDKVNVHPQSFQITGHLSVDSSIYQPIHSRANSTNVYYHQAQKKKQHFQTSSHGNEENSENIHQTRSKMNMNNISMFRE